MNKVSIIVIFVVLILILSTVIAYGYFNKSKLTQKQEDKKEPEKYDRQALLLDDIYKNGSKAGFIDSSFSEKEAKDKLGKLEGKDLISLQMFIKKYPKGPKTVPPQSEDLATMVAIFSKIK